MLWLVCAATMAWAQNTADEAALNFDMASAAYSDNDFDQALFHFLLSNRISPNRNVTFNIGRTYEAMGRFEEAYRWYQIALTFEGPSTDRVSGAITTSMARIRPNVALFLVESSPSGASVYVDRVELGAVGTTPVEIALVPGTYKLIVEREGHRPATTEALEVKKGEVEEVAVTLAPIVGEVAVTGEPGATVHIGQQDAEPRCTVPCTVELSEGTQILYFKKSGFKSTPALVEIEEGATIAITADLVPVTGTVVVDADERGALIEIDDRPVGYTPAVLTNVQVGRRTVRVSLRGYQPWEREVDVVEDGTLDLGRVTLDPTFTVTAASRAAESVVEAPASVSLISAEEIRAFGYQSLYEAVAGVRGFYQTDDLTYTSLGVRGFGRTGDYGNRLLLTVDGHTMNDDQIGSSFVGDDFLTDLQDVQQIEVVRGPGSALYGSNAVFGVINLVMRDEETVPAPHVSVTGAEGSIRARVGAGVAGKNAGAWFSLAGLYGPGSSYQFDELADLPRGGISENSDETTARTVLAKAWAGDLTVQGAYYGREKEIPTGSFDTNVGDANSTSNDYRAYVEARTDTDLKTTDIDVRLYVDYYRFFGYFPYGAGYILNDLYDGLWLGAEPRITQHISDAIDITAGVETRQYVLSDLRSEEIEAPGEESFNTPLQERPTFQVYSGYAVLDIHPGDLMRLNVGGRVDAYNTTVDDLTTFNPRAALILSPGNEVFKVMGGTAFRAPSPYEYFYTDGGISTIAPDSLAPESIATGEVEWTHQFDQVTTSTVSTYYNQITDLIDTEVVPDQGDVFRYANIDGQVSSVGAEAEVRRSWRSGWMTATQVSWQRTRVGTIDTDVEFENSPEWLTAVMGAAPLGPNSTLAGKVRGASRRLTRAGRQTPIEVILDLTVTGDIPTLAATYGFGVRNLLDWTVAHPTGPDLRQDSLQQPGRELFGTVTINF